jgi:adenylate cyclase
MSFEIERKFLVRGNDWERLATRRISLRQAYLACNGKASIRIRIKDDGAATLTVKSRPADLRRLELEYDIPVLEAEALMKLRQGSIIEKVRHVIPYGDLAWEVDVFSGDNFGLIIAEIELRHETSNCRPGSAQRSPGSRSITTAPWCSVHFAHGRVRKRPCRSKGARDRVSRLVRPASFGGRAMTSSSWRSVVIILDMHAYAPK